MKVLLIGEHFSSNLGDQLISLCFQKYLDSRNIQYSLLELSHGEEIKDAKNKKKQTKVLINLVKNSIRKIRTVDEIINIYYSSKLMKVCRDKCKDCDMAIYVGGSIFMDFFAPKMFFINRTLEKLNVDIVYNACGAGALNSKINKWMIKTSNNIKQVKEITLRDSQEELSKLLSKKPIKAYDIGLLASDYFTRSKRTSIVGIGYIRLNESFNNIYSKSIEKLIIEFEKKHIKWELFSNGSEGDYEQLKKLYSIVSKKIDVKYGSIAERPTSIGSLIKCITKYNKIITCRLHSAIISYSFQIPTIIVKWSPKIEFFYDDINHKELVVDPNFNVNEIINKIRLLEYNNEDRNRLVKMKNSIKENVDSIIKS